MKKTRLLVAVLLTPVSGLCTRACSQARPATRPNVIIILGDDVGYGDFGCYGARNVETPHIDRLAASGTRFTDCHAVAATSTPSRYSLLTGEYAWRRQDTDVAPGNAGMIIRPSQFTLADLFRSEGYATAAVGKWHLGLGDRTGGQDWNAPLPMALQDIGFDYSYIMAATADRVPCVFIENGRVANHDPAAPIEVNYQHPYEGVPTGEEHPELMYNLQPSDHGHNQAIVNGIGRIGYMKGGGKALWKDEDIADSITAHALGFIRDHRHAPFFLYLATNDIHVPRFPHPRFRGKSGMGLRGDAIVQMDWTVGEVMKALKEYGLEENTLVILTSDNGPIVDDGYKDHAAELLHGHKPTGPYRGSKYSTYEGGTAVPLIASWPRHIKAGVASKALVSHIDLMASLCSLVNGTMPTGSAPDSHDHLGAFLGKDSVGRAYVIEASNSRVLSVRTPRWKYIEPSDGPERLNWCPEVETGNNPQPQLFDMAKGVWEEGNVATLHPQVVYDMQNILRRERER